MNPCLGSSKFEIALAFYSLERSSGVAVSLESTVVHVGASVHKVWHDWLVLRTVPRNVSWLSDSVSVAGLVVLMEHWLLSSSPLSVGVWNWRVLWENSADVPPEQVWVVQQGSRVELMVVENNWSLVSQTSAESLGHEDDQVEVSEPASDVEVLDWKLSDDSQTKEASKLSSGGVVSPVPIGLRDRSHDDVLILILREPGLENVKVFLRLVSPGRKPLFHVVLRQTEADKIIILNVLGGLEVSHSSLSIIEGVLYERKS